LIFTHSLYTGFDDFISIIIAKIAIKIKKSHGVNRLDPEDDFNFCVEVFHDLILTEPSDEQTILALDSKIKWDDIKGNVLDIGGIDIGTTGFLIECLRYFKHDQNNEFFKLDSSAPDFVARFSTLFNDTTLSSSMFRTALIFLYHQHESDIPGLYGSLVFLISFGLSRNRSFREMNWTRRGPVVSGALLDNNGLIQQLNESSARLMCEILTAKVKDKLDPKHLSAELSSVVGKSYSHIPQMVAVINQVEYKEMTPVQLIGRAMAERTEVPWEALLHQLLLLLLLLSRLIFN